MLWDAGGQSMSLLHYALDLVLTLLPKQLLQHYFLGIPVQDDMNNEVGSGCFHIMWAGDENQ